MDGNERHITMQLLLLNYDDEPKHYIHMHMADSRFLSGFEFPAAFSPWISTGGSKIHTKKEPKTAIKPRQ